MDFGLGYWKGKKINCLGDSITWGDGNEGVSWVDYLKEAMPETDIVKYGVCGSTVCVGNDRDDSFIERMGSMDMDYDVCVIFGGVNDFNQGKPLGGKKDRETDTLYGAYRSMVEYLLGKNPKGELVCLTPMRVRDFLDFPHWNTENKAGKRLIDYRQVILEIAGEYSVPVLDLFLESGISGDIPELKEYIQKDGLHPTNEGYLRLTRKIYRFLNMRL